MGYEQAVASLAKAEPLKIMILGAPASGKGTQCELIIEKVSSFLFILPFRHLVSEFTSHYFMSSFIGVIL